MSSEQLQPKAGSVRKSSLRRWLWGYALAFLIIVVLAGLPIFGALIGASIAAAAGCQVDEGSIHPCVILGYDAGEAIYSATVLAWLGLATIPFGMMLLGALAVIAALHLLGWLLLRWRSAAAR